MDLKILHLIVLLLFILNNFNNIKCPPVLPSNDKVAEEHHDELNNTLENDPILQLEYHRYLKEIVNVLETDNNFKKMIENASVDDIKSGKIATHLDLVHHNVRTKLDELKRKEIDRLRQLISRKAKLNNLKPDDIEHLMPKHLDHDNIETFEVRDLEKLIRQATNDLEEVDKLRREEFKQHEIEKEYERRVNLEHLTPEERKKAEEEHQKNIEKRKHHERVNHPGSRDQLKEVWEENDHLEPEKFDPRTFFQLHDLDSNGFLDEFEIEALFQIELDKIFKKDDGEYDPAEREEEANRMREHVFGEIDRNKDKMISLDEFVAATETRDFNKNDEWKTVEDEPQFNDHEFEEYSRAHTPPTTPSPITTPTPSPKH